MKILCQYQGGSHLYGMSTPQSDVDTRGVFLNTDPLYVFGFYTKEQVTKQNTEQDLVLHELTRFLHLATNTNTQVMECLFAPKDSFEILDQNFKEMVIDQRYAFIDSEKMLSTLKGYLYNETRLAMGERTGQLGGKRKEAIDTYGFSYKNFGHLFRLAECGRYFFEHNDYPVRLKDFNPELHDFCMDVKLNPGNHNKEDLLAKATDLQAQMIRAYEERSCNWKPDLTYIRYVLNFFYTEHLDS